MGHLIHGQVKFRRLKMQIYCVSKLQDSHPWSDWTSDFASAAWPLKANQLVKAVQLGISDVSSPDKRLGCKYARCLISAIP